MPENEREYENVLRPLSLRDFSGQAKVVENLKVFVMAARMRKEALDHVLLHGPPGLGKTTLSNIIANELGVGFKVTSGPVLDKPGDLAGVLTSLEKNDVLFIDASAECVKVTNNNKLTDTNIENILRLFTERKDVEYTSKVVPNAVIGENDFNLSVSTYVEKQDTREKVDIKELNNQIAEIVAREQVLRDEIDKIIAEIEG